MSEVILVKGIANDESLKQESYLHQLWACTLEQAGHTVIQVGCPKKGFTWRALSRAFEGRQSIPLVIVDCHGEPIEEQHILENSARGSINAYDFYARMADISAQKPLNIFMISCHSLYGLESAAHLLPRNSTVVDVSDGDFAFHNDGDEKAYPPSADFLDIQSGTHNLAEQMFLAMLGKGYPNGRIMFFPKLALSKPADTVISLWHAATKGACDLPKLTMKVQKLVISQLKDYFPESTLEQAIHSMDLIRSTMMKAKTYSRSGTPLQIDMTIDPDKIAYEAEQHDILKAICAVTYVLKTLQGTLTAFNNSRTAGTTQSAPTRKSRKLASKDPVLKA